MINLKDIADLKNQVSIRLAVDLSAVQTLSAGEVFQMMGDGRPEVYIVENGRVIAAISVNADRLVISAENYKE